MYDDSCIALYPTFSSLGDRLAVVRRVLDTGGASLYCNSQMFGTTEHPDAVDPLPALLENGEDTKSPPQGHPIQRAKSYSDFYDIVTGARLSGVAPKKKRGQRRGNIAWEALAVPPQLAHAMTADWGQDDGEDIVNEKLRSELLRASQQKYTLYHDQLAMTERHLGSLIEDANGALKVIETLCQSFRAVDDQTSSFQSQCDDLLTEQKRLQTLANDVGTDLHYYAYLDTVTRRLNAPGAGRLVDDDGFGEVLSNLDSCIAFMARNPSYRDSEPYLARYQALLTKALHLLDVGFSNRLNKVSVEVSRQIAATQSESARHALAYGRFEDTLMESYSLIPNVQRVTRSAYDQNGQPVLGPSFDTYSNTVNNLFQAYCALRDRDLKPIVQHDLDTFKTEAKESSIDTAARNFVKQCFERSYNEAALFRKVFSIDPQYSTDARSAFTALKAHQRSLVTGMNIAPIATTLQLMLQTNDLRTICNLVGWMTNEYLLLDYDEDETTFTRHCRELTGRLLTEHLWTFTDAFFEAEIAKSISRTVVAPDALRIGPVVNGDGASNAFPIVKQAVELLVLFDQSMPKERCQRNSPVVFKLVKESIAALQRAEARIKSTKNGTDPDLFMVKNLLILKNELLSLEIGDVRSQTAGLQHFGQIWDTLRPHNLIGLLASFSNYIPGSSLWARASTQTPALGSTTPGGTGKSNNGAAAYEIQDANEQLDELLRQSIYAFTQRWAATVNDARARKFGGKNLVKIERELDEMLDHAFSSQPEVVAKLKEAIQIEVQAQNEAGKEKSGSRMTRS